MEIRGLAFLPILFTIWTLLGLCATVTITVVLGHAEYMYISNTGEKFPESIIFTIIFMVSSILGAGIASVQYRFMILQSHPSEKRYITCQRILYAMGWIVCIGTAVTGVCSMKFSPIVHSIGAGSAFFFLAVYNLCQSFCLYKRSFSSRRMCHIRLTSTLVTIVVLLILAVGGSIFLFQLSTGRSNKVFYIISMVGEWMGFFGLTIYPLMYYTDFQRLSLILSREGVSIILREKT